MKFCIGTDTGLVKLVQVDKELVLGTWGKQDTSQAIENFQIIEIDENEYVFLSRVNGSIEKWNLETGIMDKKIHLPKLDTKRVIKTAGIHYFTEGSEKGRIIACNSLGNVYILPFEEVTEPKEDFQVEILKQFSIGAEVEVFRVNPANQNTFAAAGNEHPLKLWDIQTQKPIWVSKNVKDNAVKLRNKIWEKDLCFIPGKENLIASVTGYSQIRIHDTKGQRRPLFHVTLGEKAFSCLSSTPDGNFLLVGDVIGNLYKFDIRARKSAGVFKGKIVGAVKQISCHPTEPIFVCSSLDRHARIFDINTRQLKLKMYLKQRLNGCAFFKEGPIVEPPAPDPEDDQTWDELKTVDTKDDSEEEEQEESEDILDNLETVGNEEEETEEEEEEKPKTKKRPLPEKAKKAPAKKAKTK